eukprot:Rmarinus@m.12206
MVDSHANFYDVLQTSVDNPSPECLEEQNNEREALANIYQMDFEDITEAKDLGPWTRGCKIRLFPSTDSINNHVAVFLVLKYGAEYPNIPPEATIEKITGLSDAKLAELRQRVNTAAAELAGNVMAFDLANLVVDFLRENNTALLSFHEEMILNHEEEEKRKKATCCLGA